MKISFKFKAGKINLATGIQVAFKRIKLTFYPRNWINCIF